MTVRAEDTGITVQSLESSRAFFQVRHGESRRGSRRGAAGPSLPLPDAPPPRTHIHPAPVPSPASPPLTQLHLGQQPALLALLPWGWGTATEEEAHADWCAGSVSTGLLSCGTPSPQQQH